MAQICTPRHVPTPRHLNFGNCAPSPLPGSHEQKFLKFFPRMFRRNAATLMNRLRVRSLVLVFAAIGRSVASVQRGFSSAQFTPSGILEARKKTACNPCGSKLMVRGHQEWTDLMKETRLDSSIVEGLTKHGREPNKSPFQVSRPRLSQDQRSRHRRHGFVER